MKYVREIIISAILPLFYLFCIVCIVGAVFYFHAKNIEQQQMILEIEKRLTLNSTGDVTTLPIKDNIDSNKLTYTVKDENVAVVHDDGTVVAVGEGTTTVTVKTDDDSKQQSIVVSVGEEAIDETKDDDYVDEIISKVEKEEKEENKTEKVEVASLSTDKDTVTLGYNETFTPNITITPENASNRKIIWTSSNPDLVTVDQDGKVTAVANEDGIATIIGMTENRLNSIAIKIPIIKKIIEAIGIKLNRVYVNLKANESTTLEATVLPSNVSDSGVEWTSSNPDLVTVDQNGKVTAVANEDGLAIITATTADGKHKALATIRVSKTSEKVSVSGITLDKNSIELKYGERSYLTATITPENATRKFIIWTSSNPTLVYVSPFGRVVALKNEDGTSTITATTIDGLKKATATVNVTKNVVKVSSIDLNMNEASLSVKQVFQFFAKIAPNNATDKRVIWKSSNPNFVDVDQSGKATVKENKNGTVIITATSEDGAASSSAKINVTKTDVKVTGIRMNKSDYALEYGKSDTISTTVLPENASNQQVTYQSSNPKLVAVNSKGEIKAIDSNGGTATITVTTKDGGYKATAQVTVNKQNIGITKIKLNKTSVNLAYGTTFQPVTTISPKNATDKSITWSSSDTTVATVNQNGVITANKNKVGIATITAKKGNISASVTVRTYPSGNAVSYKSTYSGYKTDMLITNRPKAVMQSFAMDGKNIYISQQQSNNTAGATLSITTGDKNVTRSATIKNFGHVANISIEKTNDVKYLWTDCGGSLCRVRLDAISFNNPPSLQNPSVKKYPDSDLVAVDSTNRTLVTMTGSRRYHIFTTYNLDDFIVNGYKANVIYKFTVNNGNYDYHRQGFTVSGNYIYDYEGNKSNDNVTGIFLSTFTLQGEKIVSRKKIKYPNSNYWWEPEGIKVNNGKIYIGMGKENKNSGIKTASIFKLDQ